jgi:hypothetical protein
VFISISVKNKNSSITYILVDERISQEKSKQEIGT